MEEEPKIEVLSKEELSAILHAKEKVTTRLTISERMALEAKASLLEAQLADMEYKALVQHIFIKYGMSFRDRINDATGEISRIREDELQDDKPDFDERFDVIKE